MEHYADTCRRCSSHDLEYLGAYNVRCEDCGDEFNLREQLALDPDACEACGRRLTWGCGHSLEAEHAAVEHRLTAEHQSGACWHYDHADCSPDHCAERAKSATWHPPSGYAPLMSHRVQALAQGYADPHTGEAFTSAQRQAWIDSGELVEVEDTFPV